jgi:flagellin-specific chaperone FliS
LQATLDRDRGAGVSRDLDTFYNRLRARLMEAQVKISAAILTEEIEELLSVREAWLEVERTSSQGGTLPASESGVPADQFMKAASDEQV